MDENLANELENILKLPTEDAQEKAIGKIMFYLLTLPSVDGKYRHVLERFTDKALELLPSSTLPQQLMKKFLLPNQRKKRVFFSSESICQLKSAEKTSQEAKEQELREKCSLSINNTDPSRQFIPRKCFSEGMAFKTKIIPLISCNLKNSIEPKLMFTDKKFTKITLDLSQILNDPKCLENLI